MAKPIPPPDVAITNPPDRLMAQDWYDFFFDQNPGAGLKVAGLPPVGSVGRRRFVTDATVTTFASVVAGGGANKVPVYDDGTNWRIG
jgi:hypothetical protein